MGEPAGVELVVWDESPENGAKKDGDGSGEEEQDFPGGDAVVVDRKAVGDEAAEDLREAVEGAPEADTETLFFFGIPLSFCK